MGGSWKYFDVENYNDWKRKQGKNFKSPPRPNYLAAAIYIRNLFDEKNVRFAALGSLAMLCLGFPRPMPDIHFVYDDRDFTHIKDRLEADQRVRLPSGVNALFPTKILLRTGPVFKDRGCTENLDVEVDLVPPGAYGTPRNDVLHRNQILLRLNFDGNTQTFKGLNMLYLVKTTLSLCTNQDLAWDPKKDIAFLCEQYGKEIQAIQSQLDQRQLHDAFFSSSYFAGLPTEGQRKCSILLLGKELIRSSAPARPLKRASIGLKNAPTHGSRPIPSTYHSTTNLNSGLHPPSNGQRPTIPSKDAGPSQLSGTQANALHQTHYSTGPNAPVVPVYSAGQNSRSETRPVSDPNTLGSSKKPSPSSHKISQTNTSSPISMDPRYPNHSYAAPPVQSLSNTAWASIPRGYAPVPPAVGPAPQNSMPSTIASRQGNAIPPNITHNFFTQNYPGVSGISLIPQKSTAAPIPADHRDQTRPDQQVAPRQHHGRDGPNRSQLGGTPYTVRHDHLDPSNFPPQPEHYQPSSASNSSHASMTRPADPTTPQSIGLQVVGPDGLYLPPAKPIAGLGALPARQRPASHCALGQTTFAFELPATAPIPKPRSDSPNGLYNVSPPAVQGPYHRPYKGGPVDISPPGQTSFAFELPASTTPAPDRPQPSRLATPPSHSHAHSTPTTALPASLMIGGPAHRRSHAIPNSSLPIQPQPSNVQAAAPTYHAHPISPPTTYAAYSPPKPIVEPAYKAYSGLASLPAASAPNNPIPTSSTKAEVTSPMPQHQSQPSNTHNSLPTTEGTPASKPARKLTPPLPPLNTNLSTGKQAPQQQYPINKRLSLTAELAGKTNNASPVTASATPSSSHITEQLSKYYQYGDEVHYGNLPPMPTSTTSDIAPLPLKPRRKSTFQALDNDQSQTPTQEKPLEKKLLERKVTGYEAFIHGPYTPISAATERAQQSVYDQCRDILEQAELTEKSDLQRLERKYTVQEFEWEDSPVDRVRRQDSYYEVAAHYDGYRY